LPVKIINKEKPMRKSLPTDQQTDSIGDEKESPAKFDKPRWTGAILEVFDRILFRLAGFIILTEQEQREAGVYFGDRRND
jgi:hypothetical protein